MEEPLRAISFLEDYEAICKEVRVTVGVTVRVRVRV